MWTERGLAFSKVHEARFIIDEGVEAILNLLGPSPVEFEVERILRMGACGTKGRRTSAEDVYRRLSMQKHEIGNVLRENGMPGVAKLLAWGHLIPVIGSLKVRKGESPSASMDKLSLHWGFDSGGGISQRCKHHTGVYPTAITGLQDLTNRFVAEWQAPPNLKGRGR